MLRHLSINTEKTYIHWLGRYASFLGDQPSAKLLTTEQKIEGFLTRLAITGVSASTQNQAFNALLSFPPGFLNKKVVSLRRLLPESAVNSQHEHTIILRRPSRPPEPWQWFREVPETSAMPQGHTSRPPLCHQPRSATSRHPTKSE
jgi:hypothetical protein